MVISSETIQLTPSNGFFPVEYTNLVASGSNSKGVDEQSVASRRSHSTTNDPLSPMNGVFPLGTGPFEARETEEHSVALSDQVSDPLSSVNGIFSVETSHLVASNSKEASERSVASSRSKRTPAQTPLSPANGVYPIAQSLFRRRVTDQPSPTSPKSTVSQTSSSISGAIWSRQSRTESVSTEGKQTSGSSSDEVDERSLASRRSLSTTSRRSPAYKMFPVHRTNSGASRSRNTDEPSVSSPKSLSSALSPMNGIFPIGQTNFSNSTTTEVSLATTPQSAADQATVPKTFFPVDFTNFFPVAIRHGDEPREPPPKSEGNDDVSIISSKASKVVQPNSPSRQPSINSVRSGNSTKTTEASKSESIPPRGSTNKITNEMISAQAASVVDALRSIRSIRSDFEMELKSDSSIGAEDSDSESVSTANGSKKKKGLFRRLRPKIRGRAKVAKLDGRPPAYGGRSISLTRRLSPRDKKPLKLNRSSSSSDLAKMEADNADTSTDVNLAVDDSVHSSSVSGTVSTSTPLVQGVDPPAKLAYIESQPSDSASTAKSELKKPVLSIDSKHVQVNGSASGTNATASLTLSPITNDSAVRSPLSMSAASHVSCTESKVSALSGNPTLSPTALPPRSRLLRSPTAFQKTASAPSIATAEAAGATQPTISWAIQSPTEAGVQSPAASTARSQTRNFFLNSPATSPVQSPTGSVGEVSFWSAANSVAGSTIFSASKSVARSVVNIAESAMLSTTESVMKIASPTSATSPTSGQAEAADLGNAAASVSEEAPPQNLPPEPDVGAEVEVSANAGFEVLSIGSDLEVDVQAEEPVNTPIAAVEEGSKTEVAVVSAGAEVEADADREVGAVAANNSEVSATKSEIEAPVSDEAKDDEGNGSIVFSSATGKATDSESSTEVDSCGAEVEVDVYVGVLSTNVDVGVDAESEIEKVASKTGVNFNAGIGCECPELSTGTEQEVTAEAAADARADQPGAEEEVEVDVDVAVSVLSADAEAEADVESSVEVDVAGAVVEGQADAGIEVESTKVQADAGIEVESTKVQADTGIEVESTNAEVEAASTGSKSAAVIEQEKCDSVVGSQTGNCTKQTSRLLTYSDNMQEDNGFEMGLKVDDCDPNIVQVAHSEEKFAITATENRSTSHTQHDATSVAGSSGRRSVDRSTAASKTKTMEEFKDGCAIEIDDESCAIEIDDESRVQRTIEVDDENRVQRVVDEDKSVRTERRKDIEENASVATKTAHEDISTPIPLDKPTVATKSALDEITTPNPLDKPQEIVETADEAEEVNSDEQVPICAPTERKGPIVQATTIETTTLQDVDDKLVDKSGIADATPTSGKKKRGFFRRLRLKKDGNISEIASASKSVVSAKPPRPSPRKGKLKKGQPTIQKKVEAISKSLNKARLAARISATKQVAAQENIRDAAPDADQSPNQEAQEVKQEATTVPPPGQGQGETNASPSPKVEGSSQVERQQGNGPCDANGNVHNFSLLVDHSLRTVASELTMTSATSGVHSPKTNVRSPKEESPKHHMECLREDDDAEVEPSVRSETLTTIGPEQEIASIRETSDEHKSATGGEVSIKQEGEVNLNTKEATVFDSEKANEDDASKVTASTGSKSDKISQKESFASTRVESVKEDTSCHSQEDCKRPSLIQAEGQKFDTEKTSGNSSALLDALKTARENVVDDDGILQPRSGIDGAQKPNDADEPEQYLPDSFMSTLRSVRSRFACTVDGVLGVLDPEWTDGKKAADAGKEENGENITEQKKTAPERVGFKCGAVQDVVDENGAPGLSEQGSIMEEGVLPKQAPADTVDPKNTEGAQTLPTGLGFSCGGAKETTIEKTGELNAIENSLFSFAWGRSRSDKETNVVPPAQETVSDINDQFDKAQKTKPQELVEASASPDSESSKPPISSPAMDDTASNKGKDVVVNLIPMPLEKTTRVRSQVTIESEVGSAEGGIEDDHAIEAIEAIIDESSCLITIDGNEFDKDSATCDDSLQSPKVKITEWKDSEEATVETKEKEKEKKSLARKIMGHVPKILSPSNANKSAHDSSLFETDRESPGNSKEFEAKVEEKNASATKAPEEPTVSKKDRTDEKITTKIATPAQEDALKNSAVGPAATTHNTVEQQSEEISGDSRNVSRECRDVAGDSADASRESRDSSPSRAAHCNTAADGSLPPKSKPNKKYKSFLAGIRVARKALRKDLSGKKPLPDINEGQPNSEQVNLPIHEPPVQVQEEKEKTPVRSYDTEETRKIRHSRQHEDEGVELDQRGTEIPEERTGDMKRASSGKNGGEGGIGKHTRDIMTRSESIITKLRNMRRSVSHGRKRSNQSQNSRTSRGSLHEDAKAQRAPEEEDDIDATLKTEAAHIADRIMHIRSSSPQLSAAMENALKSLGSTCESIRSAQSCEMCTVNNTPTTKINQDTNTISDSSGTEIEIELTPIEQVAEANDEDIQSLNKGDKSELDQYAKAILEQNKRLIETLISMQNNNPSDSANDNTSGNNEPDTNENNNIVDEINNTSDSIINSIIRDNEELINGKQPTSRVERSESIPTSDQNRPENVDDSRNNDSYVGNKVSDAEKAHQANASTEMKGKDTNSKDGNNVFPKNADTLASELAGLLETDEGQEHVLGASSVPTGKKFWRSRAFLKKFGKKAGTAAAAAGGTKSKAEDNENLESDVEGPIASTPPEKPTEKPIEKLKSRAKSKKLFGRAKRSRSRDRKKVDKVEDKDDESLFGDGRANMSLLDGDQADLDIVEDTVSSDDEGDANRCVSPGTIAPPPPPPPADIAQEADRIKAKMLTKRLKAKTRSMKDVQLVLSNSSTLELPKHKKSKVIKYDKIPDEIAVEQVPLEAPANVKKRYKKKLRNMKKKMKDEDSSLFSTYMMDGLDPLLNLFDPCIDTCDTYCFSGALVDRKKHDDESSLGTATSALTSFTGRTNPR